MSNKLVEQDLLFQLETSSIAEITSDDGWIGDGVVCLDDEEIKEMTGDDNKPFYVDFVALYEDMSGNDRVYGKDAVTSCVDAMVGVNMYKGHEEPGTQNWKYREPVGRVVAAKLDTIEIDGKRVLAAKGKAYITDADPKLRSDIKKKMAGNVSILGNAKMVRKMNETTRHVVHLHKPLKSVDFCNPGTGGLSHAGVTAVVSEMAGVVTETEVQEIEENKMTIKKLTKPELLTEYNEEITALIGEQIENQVREMAKSKREVAEEREAFNTQKITFDSQIAEMKTKLNTVEATSNDWKAKYEAERNLRITAELDVFVNGVIAEMKGADGANEKLIDMAVKRTKASVVEGDLEKSKVAYKKSLNDSIEEVTELSEMFGGEKKQTVSDDKKTTRHKDNPGKKDSDMSRFLSPEMRKARADRAGV